MFAKEYSSIINRSIAAQATFQSAFAASTVVAPTQYNIPSTGNNANNGLAQQIQTVARVIGARNAVGAKRQIFFVSMGGFDTHDGQNPNQADLMARISHALGYFDTVMSNIGGVDMRNNVTMFTASDFGRTMTSNGDGTDHGWGPHHFVVGGASTAARSTAFPHSSSTPRRAGKPLCQRSRSALRLDDRQWFGVATPT